MKGGLCTAPDHSLHIAVPKSPGLDYLTSRYRLLEISNFEHCFVSSEVEQSRRHQGKPTLI